MFSPPNCLLKPLSSQQSAQAERQAMGQLASTHASFFCMALNLCCCACCQAQAAVLVNKVKLEISTQLEMVKDQLLEAQQQQVAAEQQASHAQRVSDAELQDLKQQLLIAKEQQAAAEQRVQASEAEVCVLKQQLQAAKEERGAAQWQADAAQEAERSAQAEVLQLRRTAPEARLSQAQQQAEGILHARPTVSIQLAAQVPGEPQKATAGGKRKALATGPRSRKPARLGAGSSD